MSTVHSVSTPRFICSDRDNAERLLRILSSSDRRACDTAFKILMQLNIAQETKFFALMCHCPDGEHQCYCSRFLSAHELTGGSVTPQGSSDCSHTPHNN